MDLARRYRFNLPWGAIAFGVVFYGALSACMVRLASDFDGVIFLFIIVLSAMFAVLAFIMMTRRIVFPRMLELAEDAILFPHGFPWTRITGIPYVDIIRMSEAGVGAQFGLYLATARGNFEIRACYLPDIESYNAVRDFICAKTSIVIPRHDKQEPPSDWSCQGFPKPILRWVEPEDWPRYRTRLVVSKPLWLRLAKALWFFVRCFGIIILPWFLLRFFRLPTAPAASYLCLATAVTLFFTLLHWLKALWPVHATEISFLDTGITQFFGKQTLDRTYHDISGWAVIERPFEGRVLHILLLKGRTRVTAFALPDTDTRDRLVKIFHDKMIPQSPEISAPWESRQ